MLYPLPRLNQAKPTPVEPLFVPVSKQPTYPSGVAWDPLSRRNGFPLTGPCQPANPTQPTGCSSTLRTAAFKEQLACLSGTARAPLSHRNGLPPTDPCKSAIPMAQWGSGSP